MVNPTRVSVCLQRPLAADTGATTIVDAGVAHPGRHLVPKGAA